MFLDGATCKLLVNLPKAKVENDHDNLLNSSDSCLYIIHAYRLSMLDVVILLPLPLRPLLCGVTVWRYTLPCSLTRSYTFSPKVPSLWYHPLLYPATFSSAFRSSSPFISISILHLLRSAPLFASNVHTTLTSPPLIGEYSVTDDADQICQETHKWGFWSLVIRIVIVSMFSWQDPTNNGKVSQWLNISHDNPVMCNVFWWRRCCISHSAECFMEH